MDTQALFSHGGEMVKNPNYSPNNGQPEYINNTDISKTNNSLASTFYKATEEGLNYSVTDKDLIRKSKKYGVPLTKESIESGAIDKQFYDAQSGFSKIFNSIEQTLISEIGLGTLKGFSEIADMIGNAITHIGPDKDNDRSFLEESALTKFIANLQEKNKKAFEINTDPNVHLGSGALGNLGWYANNLPSIASSITLLIPSRFITKAVSSTPRLLSKGVNALNKTEKVTKESSNLVAFTMKGKKAVNNLNKDKSLGIGSIGRELRKQRFENISDAALMRTMENYQEAKQANDEVFNIARNEFADNQKYADFINNNPQFVQELRDNDIDLNDKDEVARYIAKKSAMETFKLDYANIVFDLVQVVALKNPAKIGKNRVWKGRKVAQAQRRRIENPLESLDAVATKEKADNILKKTSNLFKDLSGIVPSLLAQASEGVEEAVNYIAQQQGITYGNVILNKEEPFAYRFLPKAYKLNEYMHNPEMWDAAFWGFVGGIAFGIGGSEFNARMNALNERRQDKKKGITPSKFNDYVKKYKEDIYRINDISSSSIELNNLINQFALINNGQNPFRVDENGEYRTFVDNNEIENAKARVKKQTIDTLALNALQASNYDMLEAFLINPNVRKALIDAGVMEEKDSQAFMDDVVSEMRNVAKIYNEELDQLDDWSSNIKEKIPVEYLQMVARKNTAIRLDNELLELDKNLYNTVVENIITTMQEQRNQDPTSVPIPENINDLVRLRMYASRLSEVQAQLKTLKEDEDVRSSVDGSIAISRLNKEKTKLLNEIQLLKNVDAPAATIWSLLHSELGIIDNDGKAKIANITGDYVYYEKAIRDHDKKIVDEWLKNNGLESLGKNLDLEAFFTENKQGTYNLLADELGKLNKFLNDNPNLANKVNSAEYLSLMQLENNSTRINNSKELLEEINYINDSLKDAYSEAEKQARDKILEIADKLENGEQKVYQFLFNNEKINDISDEDLATLESAKNIMNFSERSLGYIDKVKNDIQTQFRNKEIKKLQEEEKSTTSENPQDGTQPIQPIDTKAKDTKSSTEEKNGISGSNNGQNGSQQMTKVHVIINADEFNKLQVNQVIGDNEGDDIVELNNYAENQYELRVSQEENRAKNNVKNLLKSTTLFNGYDEQQEKNKGVTRVITENPVLTIENVNGQSIYKVVKKGRIVYNLNDSVYSFSSTGDVKPTKNDTPNDDEILASNEYKEISQARNNLVDDNIQIYVKDGLSLNEIVKLVNKTIKNNYPNASNETIDAVYEDTKSYIISLLALNDENTNKELADAIAKLTGVALNSSTVDENVEMTQDAFEAVKEILPYYINRHDIPAYKSLNNGKPKYFINLEQLLTDINDIYNDKGIIGIVYNFVRDYLNTEEGRNKYVITDLNSDAPDFLEKLNKKIEEPTREPNTTIQTGDTSSLEAEDFEHLLKLEDDTEVTVTVEDYKKGKRTYKRLVLNHKDGDKTYRVGTLPLANYSNNGIYSMYIQGWAYELNDDNGHINSNVLDIFVELLKNKDIYNTLVQIRSKSITNDERKELQKKLSDIVQNYEFNGKKLKDFIFEPEEEGEEKTEEYQEIKHLEALISYDLRKLSYEEAKDKIRDSVYNFIRKVYNSYSSAKHVQDRINDNQEVSLNVTKVPAGYFEEIVKEKSSPDDILSNHYDELELSNKGLQNLNTVRLGLKDRQIGKQGGDIKLDDGTILQSMPNIFAGNIIISILNKNGIPFNTKAVSVRLGDKDLNNPKIKDENKSTAYKVVKIIKNEINKRLDDWKETDEHFEDFVDFLKSLLYRNRTNDINEPLLQGIVFNDLRKTEGYVEIGIHNSVSIHISNTQIQISTKDPESDKWNFATYTKSGNYKIDTLKKKFEQLLNNAYFNISFVTLKEFEPNNKTGDVTKGFITKDGTGKLVLKIPSIKGENEIITADDYKHFILEGGFVRVNVKKHNRTFTTNGEKKVVDTGNFIFGNNSRIQIEVPDMIDISTPIKEDMVRVEPTKSSVQKAIESKKNNAFRIAFKLANLDKIKVQRNGKEHIVNVLNMLKKFGLYADNITFEETLNTRDTQFNYTGPIANVNPSTGEITVGQRWLDMFNTKGKYANPKNRAVAIRKLIHETLHTKFHQDDNIKYVKQLQEVFDDFKKYVNEKEKSGEISKEDAAKMRVYFFTDVENKVNDDITESQAKLNALEEFVVESFTNSELANFLNSITVEGYKVKDVKKKDRTLFQKILDFLAEIFNWNINDDTLYAKEYLLLTDGITKLEEPITKEEQQELDKQVEKIENKEQTKEFNSEEFKNDRRSRRREAFKSTDRARDNIKESTREERLDSLDKGYNSEMQSIKDKAIANGTFMKAPNGKSTNLNERQWLQVRTNAFKNWFGDWENDPANSSKVVDENGEPLVVYHGTNFKFNSFSKDKRGSYTGAKSANLAFFAASNIKNAEKYLTPVSERFQSFIGKDGSEEVFDVFEKQLQKNKDEITYEIYKRERELEENPLFQIEELKNEYGKGYILSLLNIPEFAKKYPKQAKLYEEEVNKIEDKLLLKINPHIKSVFLNIRNIKIDDDKNTGYRSSTYAKRISDSLQENKDGGVIKNTKDPLDTDVYYFFEPNQIKSVTDNNGEFSKTNNNIYQSTRDEHFENVNDFINSAKPRDKKLLLEGINNGEISNICN